MKTPKKPGTGIPRSLLFTPEQDDRMNRLCQEVGLNRNALVRVIAEKARPEDILAMMKR